MFVNVVDVLGADHARLRQDPEHCCRNTPKKHKKHIEFVDEHLLARDPGGVILLFLLVGQLLLELVPPFLHRNRVKTYQKA